MHTYVIIDEVLIVVYMKESCTTLDGSAHIDELQYVFIPRSFSYKHDVNQWRTVVETMERRSKSNLFEQCQTLA